jgi:hypothetical protein
VLAEGEEYKAHADNST